MGPGDNVLDRDPAQPKKGAQPPPIFVGVGPGDSVLDRDSAPPSQKGGHSRPPQFSAHFCCGKMAELIKMPLDTEVASAQATLC